MTTQPRPALPAPPSDGTTLLEVLDEYRRAGYSSDFSVEPGGTVRCGRCAGDLDGQRLPTLSLRRLEGASDPADMMAVVATECPVCGADGTLVLGFGPMASADDSRALRSLADARGEHGLPGGATPEEMPRSVPASG